MKSRRCLRDRAMRRTSEPWSGVSFFLVKEKLYQPFGRRALLKNLCFGSFFAMALPPVRASRFSNVHWKLSMLPNKPRPASIWVSSSGLRPSCIFLHFHGHLKFCCKSRKLAVLVEVALAIARNRQAPGPLETLKLSS